jgi:hypothetical protein
MDVKNAIAAPGKWPGAGRAKERNTLGDGTEGRRRGHHAAAPGALPRPADLPGPSAVPCRPPRYVTVMSKAAVPAAPLSSMTVTTTW